MKEILGYPLGYVMRFIYSLTHEYGLSLIILILIYKFCMIPYAYKRTLRNNINIYMRDKLKSIHVKYRLYPKKYKKYTDNYKKRCCLNKTSSFDRILSLTLLYGLYDVIYRPLTHIFHLSKDTVNDLVKITENSIGLPESYGNKVELALVNAIKSNPSAYYDYPDVVYSVSNFNNTIFNGLIDLNSTPSIKIDDILSGNYSIFIPLSILIVYIAKTVIDMIISYKNDREMYEKNKSFNLTLLITLCISECISISLPVTFGIFILISMIFESVQSIILYNVCNSSNIYGYIEKMRKKNKIDDLLLPIDDYECNPEDMLDEKCIVFEEKTELSEYQKKVNAEIHNQYLAKYPL